MFLQHFIYFHYHSNHNFQERAKQKKIGIISTLPRVHIPSFIKLALKVVFQLSQDPDFSGQTAK